MRRRTRAAIVALGLAVAAAAPHARVAEVAASLRALYGNSPSAHERWGGGAPEITLPHGARVTRDQAWRDDAAFEPAATLLLGQPGDAAALGAWLLRGRVEPAAPATRVALLATLGGADGVASTEAARTLAARGGAEAVAGLAAVSRRPDVSPITRAAAAWAAAEIRGSAAPRHSTRLPRRFKRGVNWWYEAQDGDSGADSFQRLRRIGVDWISIHTWDPLQISASSPDFDGERRRFVPRDLGAVVRAAHAAGLAVLSKPHLEMARIRLTDAERASLRGPDVAARERVMATVRERRERQGWHGEIEMKTEAQWAAWFANYEAYLLAHARDAAAAGVDAFCVGRELDRTALAREQDWRALIGRVRAVFRGPLTYSAHHDTFDQVGFWDALDFVGVSAYFPVARSPRPADAEIARGWIPIQSRLAALGRRTGKPVVATELGYAAIAGAGGRPWEERDISADPWLQARLLDRAFAALSRTERVEGAFVWLWEGVGNPPFRDPSFTINGKPAEFALARWFGDFGS